MKIPSLFVVLWVIWIVGAIAIFVLPMPGPESLWYLGWGFCAGQLIGHTTPRIS